MTRTAENELAVGALPGAAGGGLWRLVELAAGLLIGAITVLVSVQVFARYVLNDTPAWSEELCRYFFVWASFLGACVAMRRTAHLGVDSLVTRLPAGAREVVRHAVCAVIGVFAAIMVWQGQALVPEMATQRSPSMGISLQYVFAAIPIAGALILALQIRDLARAWASPAVRTGIAIVAVAAVAIWGGGRMVEVSPPAALVALVAVMVVLIALHTPIVFAVGIACVVYIVLRGDIPLIVVPHRMIGGMDSFLLLALPLFVLAGDLMNTGGITERLVGFARALVGHIRGGLGMTTVVSEYLFSGISGSSAADVSGSGFVADPFHDAGGVSAGTGRLDRGCGLGHGRPRTALPDDGRAGEPHGPVHCRALHGGVSARRGDGRPAPRADLRSGAAPESAARAAPVRAHGDAREPAGSAAADLPRHHSRGHSGRHRHAYGGGGAGRHLRARARDGGLPRDPPARPHADPDQHRFAYRHGDAARRHRIGAVVDLRFAGRPEADRGLLLGFSSSPMLLLLVTILVFVPLGAVLEGVPAMIILVPVFFPIIARFGIDPLHYGVLVVASLGLGLFVPPFGVGFFIACALGGTSVEGAARAYLPYLAVLLIGLLVVAFVPWITLVVPRLFNL